MFVTSAPSRSPPSAVSSILSRGRRVMSTSRLGRSTFSFIRSIRFVPPAMNFAAPSIGDLAHGGRHVVGPDVGKAVHRSAPPSVVRIACSIAATMFG